MSNKTFLPRTPEQLKLLSRAYKYLAEDYYEAAAEYFVASSKVHEERTEKPLSDSEFLEALNSVSDTDSYTGTDFNNEVKDFETEANNMFKDLEFIKEE